MPRTYVFTAYGGPENQQLLDLPMPTPGQDELLVRVRAASVNPADAKRREGAGRYYSPDPLRAPQPMGIEASGVVDALGPGVSGFAVGDEVFGYGVGSWADYVLLPTSRTAHKPTQISFLDAATLSVTGSTAFDCVQQILPKPGEAVLVIGVGGGVGIAAAQIATSRGARVLGTASASKRELVESVGTVHIAYDGPDIADRILALAPAGIDAAMDMVGDDAMRAVGKLVKDGTRIVAAAEADAASEFGGARVKRSGSVATLDAVARLVAEGALNPCVTATFPLERAGEALALVESHHAAGKIVIEVS